MLDFIPPLVVNIAGLAPALTAFVVLFGSAIALLFVAEYHHSVRQSAAWQAADDVEAAFEAAAVWRRSPDVLAKLRAAAALRAALRGRPGAWAGRPAAHWSARRRAETW